MTEDADSLYQQSKEAEAHDINAQLACDHTWEFVNDSFDHAFGCEQVHFYRCEKCGAEKPHEPYDGPE